MSRTGIYSGSEKERNKQAVKKYQQTAKGKITQKRANQKPMRKAKNKIYRRSTKGKATRRKYQNKHYNPQERRKRSFKYLYNITLENYDKMFENQNGVCAICGKINECGRRLAVDHCHKTGKIRGLLCIRCNIWLGKFENYCDLFKKFEKYLKR